MSSLTDEQRLQLWRRSISLANAPYRLAHPEKQKAYDAAMSESAMGAFERAVQSIQDSGKTGVEAVTELFAEPSRIVAARSDIMSSMRSNTLKWCKSGALRAFAFEVPRKLEHIPVELPRSVWSGDINWGTSQIEIGGITFIEVRLTTNQIGKEIESRYRPTEKKRGRPAIQSDLLACIETIVVDGLVDTQRSMASHYPLIRKRYQLHAKANKLTKSNISDEAIRGVFSPIYKGLKNFKKQ